MKQIQISKLLLRRFDYEFEKFNIFQSLCIFFIIDDLIIAYEKESDYPYGRLLSKKYISYYLHMPIAEVMDIFDWLEDNSIIAYEDEIDGRYYKLCNQYLPIYDHYNINVDIPTNIIHRKNRILNNFKDKYLVTEIKYNEEESFNELYSNIINSYSQL